LDFAFTAPDHIGLDFPLNPIHLFFHGLKQDCSIWWALGFNLVFQLHSPSDSQWVFAKFVSNISINKTLVFD